MKNRPNILIFMTDQQRACSVLPDHPYKAITPVLDQFRGEATTFRRAYGPAPHCCPARASFHTGLMPTQHGVWHNVCVANAISRGLKENVRPWSMDLKEAGYDLYFSGKWHVSNFQQPRDYGWEHLFPESMCHGEGMSLDEQEAEALKREVAYLKKYHVNTPSGDREPGEIKRPGQTPYIHYGDKSNPFLAQYFRGEGDENPFNDKTVVDAALDKMDTLDQAGPWCMYVGTLGPHDPYVAPRRFLELYAGMEFPLPDTFDDPMLDKPALYRRTRDKFQSLEKPEHQQAIKHYLAFCSYEDWLFGRLIEKLKARGEYENTLILYVSDHGDYLGDHGLWCKGLPSFLSCYHVPAIMKMPGQTEGEERDELVSLCDFGPTILEAAGAESQTAFAGQSLLPLTSDLRPLTSVPWRDAIFFQTNGNETYGIQRSVLTDNWRFVYNGFDFDELYDLENDPGQMKNLLARRSLGEGGAADPAYEEVKKEMYTRIWKFGLEHNEQLVNDYIMTALADFGPGLGLK
jgi:arylsulfatase A-like enzyme